MGIFKNILGTEKVIDGVGEILDNVITNKEEKLNAKAKLKEVVNNYKIEVEKNITARWEADTNGNILTRSVRPLVLIFCIVCTMLLVFIDSGSIAFEVADKWTDLLTMVLITIVGAYFGGRSVEKLKK